MPCCARRVSRSGLWGRVAAAAGRDRDPPGRRPRDIDPACSRRHYARSTAARYDPYRICRIEGCRRYGLGLREGARPINMVFKHPLEQPAFLARVGRLIHGTRPRAPNVSPDTSETIC